MTTEQELRATARRWQRHRDALEADTQARDALIRRARAEGLTLRRIAELSGVTFGRVFQLTKEA